MVSPSVSGCWRAPLTRTRVVAPYRSRWSSTARTARSWASSRPGSPVSPHHTDTDFGAENVASNPATAGISLPLVSYAVDQRRCRAVSPCTGSWPDSSASRSSVDTAPGQAEPVGLAAEPLALALRAVVGQVAGVVARRRRPPCWRGWSSPAARDSRRRRRALVCRADGFGGCRGRECAWSARGEERELRRERRVAVRRWTGGVAVSGVPRSVRGASPTWSR